MSMKNIPSFEEAYTVEEQIDYYIKNGDYPSLLKAASIKARAQGDDELSAMLSLLSAQLDFSGDDYDNGSIARTRSRLAEMIRERRMRVHMSYHSLMSDEDALSVFKGEVTIPGCIDYITGEIVENGLFDPAIFGGDGVIASLDENGSLNKNVRYGSRMGYISLPGRFLVPGMEREASVLLKIPEDKVRALVMYSSCLIVSSDDPEVKPGTIVSVKEVEEALSHGANIETMSGAGALEVLLKNLCLPDHPEKMVFSILPVVSPSLRRVFFVKECARFRHTCDLNDIYSEILSLSSRIRRLETIGAPDIILRNERRVLQECLSTLWFGRKETEALDSRDGLSGMMKIFLKNGFRRGCREIVSAKRYLLGGYIPEPAFSDPAEVGNPGFFPETVTLVSEDGENQVPYRSVIETNFDAADSLLSWTDEGTDNTVSPSESGTAHAGGKNGGMSADDIYAETDKIRIECAHSMACRVRYDRGNDVFVMAS